jgi:DNA-binding NarL/FixJ family response regulator
VIRVALVDDQTLIRAGMARLLAPEDGFEVIAECEDGRQAVDELPALRPDLVLMAIRMPRLDGIAATARLRAGEEPPPVLVLTTFGEDDVLWGAIEAGAAGFVLKDSSADDLIRAVRTVAAGDGWLDPAVTARVLRGYRAAPSAAGNGDGGVPDVLTARELEVLRAMAAGLTNSEIAESLFISELTVKSHIGRIFTKLDLRDRAAAIVYAYDHGLVAPAAH